MKLAILDIDGTLTQTNEVDERCFVRALAEAHNITELATAWANCAHVTDSGITYQVFQDRFGRAPAELELARLQECFFTLLREQHLSDAALFAEVPGATEMIRRLTQKPDWAIAIATGCWRESARVKLAAVDIDIERYPAACAEDGLAREEIVQTAIARASSHYRSATFARAVSVGDGVWDVRTARNLGLPFIGVGQETRAQELRAAGAKHVVADFCDLYRFFAFLDAAEPPQ